MISFHGCSLTGGALKGHVKNNEASQIRHIKAICSVLVCFVLRIG